MKILFSEKVIERKKALYICQSNLILPTDEPVYRDGRSLVDGMIVDKKYIKDGRLITLIVSVQKKDSEKELIKLSKSFLIGR